MNKMFNPIKISSRSLPLYVLASVFLCSVASMAQRVAPAVRIVSAIDESQRVTLTHTVSPLANAANDRGAAPDGMQLDRMQLVLQRSPGQESALRLLISQMNAPGSPSYHQWLTPDQFGAQFGPSDQDVATITSWLGSHGFAVSRVNPGKGTLEFSGSVAQLREAFHTQIHNYAINGETHYANSSDPQIPAALAPVIGGFTSLNNFRPKSYLKKLGKASFDPTTHQLSQWTWGNSSGVNFVLGPADYAVQYDLNPLYNASVNGAGQTIAIINDSNVNIDLVNQFRTLFNLPANPPQVIIDGNDPGVDGINNPDGPNGDSIEAYLDVEWSGAVAPGATIDLVIAADTSLEPGVYLAMEHAVYSNVAPAISLSFGGCEAALGSTNSFMNGLWEQAAAQGQTVMVSTGDSGSAGCDNDNTQAFADNGQAVSGFASTPYDVAVGGTDFFYSDYATGGASISNYWTTTPTQLPAVSIKQYIPEQPWNDSQFGLNLFNGNSTAGTSIAGGSGGASNAAICSNNSYSSATGECTGATSGYPKPSWQSGAGVPADGVRDIPDVSLYAANGDNYSFYPICANDGDCQTAGLGVGGLVQIYGVGGTSASSPSFAGIMALVNQKWGRQGQADNILYALKAQYPSAFHDVVNGTNAVPCSYVPLSTDCISAGAGAITFSGVVEGEIGTGTTPEYNATAGYNLATGLGTIDASNLVNDWNKVTLLSTATTMTASQTSFTHGTAITISGAVTGTGTPTGNVALETDSTEPANQGAAVFPLTSGAYSNAAVNYLPGGTYHIWGQYGGDSKNGMSTSTPPIQITVAPEAPGMDLNLFNAALGEYFTSTSGPGTSVDYGSQLMVSAMVAPASQINFLQSCLILGTNCSSLGTFTKPTGNVTFTDNGNTINTALMNVEGDAEYNAPFGVGAHSVSATYNGDQSYNKVTASAPIGFTVVKDNPAFFFNASNVTSSGQIISGQPTIFTVIAENGAQCNPNVQAQCTIEAPVPVSPPTGTITLASSPSGISGSFALIAGVDPSDEAQAGIGTLTLSPTLAAGNYNVTFSYSGDANYNGGTAGTVTIPVIAATGLASTTAATIVGAISPNSTITVTGTVTGQSGHPAPTNEVLFFSSGEGLGGVNLVPGSGDVSTFTATLSSQDLLQGVNIITLQYTGDAVYAPSEFTLSGGSSIANPQSDFALVPNATTVPININGGAGSGTDIIAVASDNSFSGNVNFTCKAAAPVTCSIVSPVSLTAGSNGTSTLTVNAPANTPIGNYAVAVVGTDAATGEFVHTLNITASVNAFMLTNGGNITIAQGATTGNASTIAVAPSGGFTGTVNLSCAVTFAPAAAANPITCGAANLNPTSVAITGATGLTSTLTINSSASTTTGTYQVTVTGTSGSITSSTIVFVTVNLPQDFAINLPSPPPLTINQGATTGNTSSITVTPLGGFTGIVTLSCSVTTQPTGGNLTCGSSNLNPTSVDLTSAASQSSALSVTTTSSTITGAYTITITGTSGAITHTTTVNVFVNLAASKNYTLSSTIPSAISPGSNAASTITVTGNGGYAGSVALTCALTSSPNGASDLPSCSITSGSPVALSSTTTSGTATATVTTTAVTADLIYPKVGNGKGWPGSRFAAASGALLSVLILLGIPARRRSWRSMLGILVAMAVIGTLSSCGGGSSGGGGGGGGGGGNPGTTAGTYTFTVTSAGSPAITPSPSTTFTVSVN